MIDLLVVLFDSKSEDGFFELLSKRAVELGRVEFNKEFLSLLFSLFSLVIHVVLLRFNCSMLA